MATIEMTINQVKDQLYDKTMLRLLVEDYETGKAIAEYDDPKWFEYSNDVKAVEIAEHIQHIMGGILIDKVKEILEAE